MAEQSFDRKALKRDVFRDTAWAWIGFLDKHRTRLISAGVVLLLILVVAGGLVYRNQIAAAEQAEAFYLAEKIFVTEKKDDKQRLAAARKSFEAFVKTFPDADLAPYGWMFLARIAWDEKDMDAARVSFQEAQKHPKALPFTRQMAAIGLARVHESRGEIEAAEAIYRALPEQDFSDLKALSLGRLALAKKETAQAREQFNKISKKFPPTRLTRWAEEALLGLPKSE